jgi:hypothetical protein
VIIMDAHPRTPRRPSLRRPTPLLVSLALTASIAGAAFGAPAAPASAAASSPPGRFVALEPCRLLDTRPQTLRGGGTVDVDVVGERCGVPAGAIAAAFTVTAVDPAGPGFVTMWPTGQERPDTSVLNYRADQVVPNAQIVQLGTQGRVRLYTSAAADLVVDVTGYFEEVDGPVSSGRFVPVEQRRLVDTRDTGRPSRGGVVEVDADVPGGAIAAAVNITTTQSSGPGYFTAYAEGTGRPTASVLNTDGVGQTRAAAAIVPLERGRFDVYTSLGDHVVVDIVGYFTGHAADPSDAGLFVASTPTRLVDTRLAAGPAGGPRLWDGGEREFAVERVTGGPVAAIAANITMADTEDAGYVSAGPARVERAAVSSVNAATAQATVANAAVIPASTHGISIATLEATHLVVDVTGWFTGEPAGIDTGAGAPVNDPPRDRRVVIISDSAMAGVRWNGALGGFQGFRAEPRLESCRRLVQSSCRGREGYAPLTAYNEILSLPQAGDEDLLVIATGYNDWNTRFASDFDQVLGAARARGFHHVAWVTYRSQVGYSIPSSGGLQSNYAEMNRILRAKVASGSFPEVRLWDLDQYTSPVPTGWFHSDGVHETVLGSWGVADWISRHVRAFDDRPCVHPWAPGGRPDDPCPNPDPLRATRGVIDIAALYGV